MSRRYGIPFGMSKNRIAAELIDFMPGAGAFVDLFAGGCAVTQAALESGKYKRVFCNDIDDRPVALFLDAIAGRLDDALRVIDRETFQTLKESDPYVRFLWSFGCKGGTYLWARGIERVKIAACNMILFPSKESCAKFQKEFKTGAGLEISSADLEWIAAAPEWNQRRLRYIKKVRGRYPRRYRDLEPLERAESLQRLHRLAVAHELWRLEPLERLASLDFKIPPTAELIVSKCDYRDAEYPADAVIYCDIPYHGSTVNREMGMQNFDFQSFYTWARNQKNIFISAYDMPEGFDCIWQKSRRSIMSDSDNTTAVIEKLFIPRENAS